MGEDGREIDDDPPDGFVEMKGRAVVEQRIGPFYERRTSSGGWQLGFRVTGTKVNAMGICHGGLIAMFGDIQGSVLKRSLDIVGRKTPTVRLDIDYVAPARLGSWVEAEPRVVSVTRGLLFFEAMVLADGEPCARMSGIYRILPEGHSGRG